MIRCDFFSNAASSEGARLTFLSFSLTQMKLAKLRKLRLILLGHKHPVTLAHKTTGRRPEVLSPTHTAHRPARPIQHPSGRIRTVHARAALPSHRQSFLQGQRKVPQVASPRPSFLLGREIEIPQNPSYPARLPPLPASPRREPA